MKPPEPMGEGGEGVVPHPGGVVMILLHQFPTETKIGIKIGNPKKILWSWGPLLIKIGLGLLRLSLSPYIVSL
jgi:hypothetical protein